MVCAVLDRRQVDCAAATDLIHFALDSPSCVLPVEREARLLQRKSRKGPSGLSTDVEMDECDQSGEDEDEVDCGADRGRDGTKVTKGRPRASSATKGGTQSVSSKAAETKANSHTANENAAPQKSTRVRS